MYLVQNTVLPSTLQRDRCILYSSRILYSSHIYNYARTYSIEGYSNNIKEVSFKRMNLKIQMYFDIFLNEVMEYTTGN